MPHHASVVYFECYLDGISKGPVEAGCNAPSLGLVLVSALALDGVEVECCELLAGAVGERALDLVSSYDRTDTGRCASQDQVALLQRQVSMGCNPSNQKRTSRVMMVEM